MLYIGGAGRSGSTILMRLLGRLPGFLAVGELWNIWEKSFEHNRRCGCGEPFHDCDFWAAVVGEAYGSLDRSDLAAILAAKTFIEGPAQLPAMAVQALRTSQYRESWATYNAALSSLYRAIRSVSGCDVVIDSSKGSRYAFALSQTRDIDLHIVHLVRDSRAVAYSLQRKKQNPAVHEQMAYMGVQGPTRTALTWAVNNSLWNALRHTTPNYRLIRYEHLCEEPDKWLTEIVRGLGKEPPADHFMLTNGTVEMGVDHTVSGNPNRFDRGPVKIRPDVEWQTMMPDGQKRLVTALTWPLLRSYGYTASVAEPACG